MKLKLSIDKQENPIVFGKSAKDETTMWYVYQDNKPVLSIK